MKRKSISKKARFEVFKRDGFACQYCGATPPGALLHVDHITPVAGGGGNEIDNLVTACQSCNSGKGARSLSLVPQSLKDKAKEVTEREEQVKAYSAVMSAKRDRLRQDMWTAIDSWGKHFKKTTIQQSYITSALRFVDELGMHVVMDAMELAVSRIPYDEDKAFKYFCGICWNKIRGAV